MKYLITESQMVPILNDYLKKLRPELFELSKFPMRRNDKNKTIQYNFNIIPLDGTFYADLDPDNELMVQEVKDRFY